MFCIKYIVDYLNFYTNKIFYDVKCHLQCFFLLLFVINLIMTAITKVNLKKQEHLI